MKNVKKLVLAALMVAVMAFALCSCGGSAADGTYVVTEVNGQDVESALKLYEAAGTKMTAEELCSITDELLFLLLTLLFPGLFVE